MENLIIRLAEEQDQFVLTNFLRRQFKTAKEFDLVEPEMLFYDKGTMLIAECNNNVLSIMQVDICRDVVYFNKICGNYINSTFHFNAYNTLFLSKAATDDNFKRIGLNNLLRKIILKSAINNTSIKSITGVAFENAPRFKTLKRLGYNFQEVKLTNNDYVQPKEKVYFLSLDRSLFKKALLILEQETISLATLYKIDLSVESSFITTNI